MGLLYVQVHVANAICAAIGVIGEAGPLPLADGEPPAEKIAPADKGSDEGAEKAGDDASVAPPAPPAPTAPTVPASAVRTREDVASGLASLLGGLKTRVAAVGAIGRVLSGDPHGPYRNRLLEALFALAKEKDPNLHLEIGEALARLSASPNRRDRRDQAVKPPPPKIKPPAEPAIVIDMSADEVAAAASAAVESAAAEPTLLPYVLGRIIYQHLTDWAPLGRQAAAAWLLPILRRAAGAPALRAAATRIQRALVSLLADANETTQELASKGLSALFDSCDKSKQAEILAELVKGLQTSAKANAHASGGDMATYQELSGIAADAGQPELVYKLMECATSSAVWNARKGVAFALAEHSRERLEEHLPRLVPMLYRQTFDPNPR